MQIKKLQDVKAKLNIPRKEVVLRVPTELLKVLQTSLNFSNGGYCDCRVRVVENNLDPLEVAVVEDDVEHWIEDWRNLFPAGINRNTGRMYKGDAFDCKKKMKAFLIKYEYDKDTIFKATKAAIKEFGLKGFLYFPQADYFIHKQHKGSMLSQWCEKVAQGIVEGDGKSSYGDTL